jgi:uroporphyrinogen-III synthase
VVVTRASNRASELTERLQLLGARVLALATIADVDPVDGGEALRGALGHRRPGDWVIATSPVGVDRLAAVIDESERSRLRLAVVGPGSAATAAAHGFVVDLLAGGAIAERLADDLIAMSSTGRALVAHGDLASPLLVDRLRGAGWDVDAVIAYRTVATPLDPEVVAAARRADAITFASGSAVRNFLAVASIDDLPAVVVCIGPTTSAALPVSLARHVAVAVDHTVDGLVTATVDALAR